MPLHSLRPGNPHAKSTLSRLSTTENSISIPAEFRQSRSLFPISRLPPAEAYLTESLGVDRFYLGYTGLGIVKLLTLGGCGIWHFVDLLLIVLKKLPDAQGRPLQFVPPSDPSDKDWGSTLLISFFLGWLGIDRFYLGYTGLGVLKLVTAGGCGVWCLVDSVLIAMNKLPDSTGKLLRM